MHPAGARQFFGIYDMNEWRDEDEALEAPTIEGLTAFGEIDLDVLGDEELKTLIKYSGMVVNDLVRVRWLGRSLTGEAYDYVADYVIDDEHMLHGLEVKIANKSIVEAAGGEAFYSYTRVADGPKPEANSFRAFCYIGVRPRGQVETPSVLQVVNSHGLIIQPSRLPSGGMRVMVPPYRGTHKLGGAETTVFVNFDSIDPTWPGTDWPDPVHPDLKPAHVNGRGSSSGDDELDRGDTGQDADITIVLSAFIQEQDILTLDWGSQVGATTHTVTADDITDGKATFPVPWPAIEAEGNKTVEVSYWVSRTDVHNPIKSQATPVAVSAVVITSEAVDFLEKNAQGQLNCTSIRNSLPHADNGAVQLAVPDLRDYEKYGPITEVDITWWAVKGGSDSQGEDEVPGVRQTFKVTIGPDYPLAGFTWRVPYEKHVAPTFDPNDAKFYRARARVTYSFKAGSESIGSKRGDIVLAMYTPSGACDLS